jgi:hypothetical protein
MIIGIIIWVVDVGLTSAVDLFLTGK